MMQVVNKRINPFIKYYMKKNLIKKNLKVGGLKKDEENSYNSGFNASFRSIFISGCTTTPSNTTEIIPAKIKAQAYLDTVQHKLLALNQEILHLKLNQENPMIHRDTNHLNLYSHFF